MRLNRSILIGIVAVFLLCSYSAAAQNMDGVLQRGKLRHLGVPYANFVTGAGDGLDVELMQGFAKFLGVKYQFVPSSWPDIITALTGNKIKVHGDDVTVIGTGRIKGDVISSGFTVLPWREKVVKFSSPVFPTQVWLIVRADSDLHPITPSGNIDTDIAQVKKLLQGRTLIGKPGTCLDPELYDVVGAGARVIEFNGNLNEFAPAIILKKADCALLDVPDALVALDKWPGQVKVIGPISPLQTMACAFAPQNLELEKQFEIYLRKIKKDGIFLHLVHKYYPTVFQYYSDFFK